MPNKTCLSNKIFLLFVSLCFTLSLCAQTYDQKIEQAAGLLQKKDFPAALTAFKNALTDTIHAGPYDLYYGAITAMHCNDHSLALSWLSLAQKKGLGLGEGELAAIKNDSTFAPLYGHGQWDDLMKGMQQAYNDKLKHEQLIAQQWVAELEAHRIPATQDNRYIQPQPGYALYFSKTDTLNVPYLVYVPSTYEAQRATRVIVYLHGGVASHQNFDDANPETRKEPIFAVADSLHALVIYPFAKKSFGWQEQPAAFTQVLTILDQAANYYHFDRHQLYMVGMSNGGTACFWFSTREHTPFRGFLALSPLPKLSIGDIDFRRLSPTRNFYSINAQDDEVFSYKDVAGIYNDKKAIATGWHFLTLPSGSHGFIYGPSGPALLQQYLSKVLAP